MSPLSPSCSALSPMAPVNAGRIPKELSPAAASCLLLSHPCQAPGTSLFGECRNVPVFAKGGELWGDLKIPQKCMCVCSNLW